MHLQFNLLTYRQISDYRTYREKLPDAVLLDAAFVDCNSDLSLLTTLTSYGISIVWCSLPDFNTIENNSVLMDFLGIANAVSPSLTVSAVSYTHLTTAPVLKLHWITILMYGLRS